MTAKLSTITAIKNYYNVKSMLLQAEWHKKRMDNRPGEILTGDTIPLNSTAKLKGNG